LDPCLLEKKGLVYKEEEERCNMAWRPPNPIVRPGIIPTPPSPPPKAPVLRKKKTFGKSLKSLFDWGEKEKSSKISTSIVDEDLRTQLIRKEREEREEREDKEKPKHLPIKVEGNE
jgi:hypothetical protein